MKRSRQGKHAHRHSVDAKPQQKDVPVDAEQWSQSSKQSYIYHAPPVAYKDITYSCWRCRKTAVYTAAEQKEAFEVHKAYIWQRRVLCPACWSQRQAIESSIRECQMRWRTQKRELRRDEEFLKGWLQLLEAHPEYGGRRNRAGIKMLQRLVDELD